MRVCIWHEQNSGRCRGHWRGQQLLGLREMARSTFYVSALNVSPSLLVVRAPPGSNRSPALTLPECIVGIIFCTALAW